MTNEQARSLYENITVTIPGLDPQKAKAINFEGFLSVVEQIERQSLLVGKQEGLLTARKIVTDTFNETSDEAPSFKSYLV
jgi:hypothetical protein